MKSKNWENQRHLVPITFGITGHRYILEEDLTRATEAISKTIRHYRSRFPLSPFVFISPLAQGADTAAAKVALEADNNLFLQVVLPFSEADYLTSIELDQQYLFHQLKNHHKTIGVITLNEEKLLTENEQNQAYLEVGEYVALNSHLLFALTNDNKELPKKGGTQEIINYRKRGCTNLLDTKSSNVRSSEQGILYLIKVRKSTEKALPVFTKEDDEVFITPTIQEYSRGQGDEARYAVGFYETKSPSWFKKQSYKWQGKSLEKDEIAANIEELNENCEKQLKEDPAAVSQEKYLTGMMFKLTDALAIKYQGNYSFNVSLIFRFAILAVCLEGFEGWIEESGIYELFPLLKHFLKLIFPTIVFVCWRLNLRAKNKELYESYRAICEALRTQSFWIRTGIKDVPADFFLVTAIGKATWVRRVIRTIWAIDFKHKKDWEINPEGVHFRLNNPTSHSEKISNQLDQLEIEWIDKQTSYFKDKKLEEVDNFIQCIQAYMKGPIKSSVIQLDLFEGLQKIFLYSFVILFILTNYPVAQFMNVVGEFEKVVEGCKLSFLLIGGLISLYIRTKLFRQEVSKYRMSFTMFKHAKSSYEQIKDIELLSKNNPTSDFALKPKEIIIKKQNVYRNLGISALDEGSIWYISNSEMELENPTGG